MSDLVARVRAWFGLPQLDDPEHVVVKRRMAAQRERIIAAYRLASKAQDKAGDDLIEEARRDD